jgi:hypothetical protein
MAVLQAAWAEWTCKGLSKEVSIPLATADTLYITVTGWRPVPSGAPSGKTRNKTPYSAHYLQAPYRGLFFFAPSAIVVKKTGGSP